MLQILSLKEQVDEMNNMIESLVNKKHVANIRDRRYDEMKEIQHMRNDKIKNL